MCSHPERNLSASHEMQQEVGALPGFLWKKTKQLRFWDLAGFS